MWVRDRQNSPKFVRGDWIYFQESYQDTGRNGINLKDFLCWQIYFPSSLNVILNNFQRWMEPSNLATSSIHSFQDYHILLSFFPFLKSWVKKEIWNIDLVLFPDWIIKKRKSFSRNHCWKHNIYNVIISKQCFIFTSLK